MTTQNNIYIPILTCKFNPPHEGATFTEQEVCDKLNYIDASIIKKALNDLDKHNFISEELSTTLTPKKTGDKKYRITSHCEEEYNKYINKLAASNNILDELNYEQ